jgi:TolB-like protein
MKKANVAIMIFFLAVTAVNAAFDYQPPARAMGLGGAFTAVCDDLSASLFNPAGLVQNRKMGVLASYDMRYVGIGQNISHSFLGVAYSMKSLSFGVAAVLDNFSIYREMTIIPSIAYSFDKFQMLSVGVNVKLLNRGFSLDNDYLSDPLFLSTTSPWNYSFDAGVLFKPNDLISIGASVQDFLQPNIAMDATQKDVLPMKINLGILLKLRQLHFSADAQYKNQEINRKLNLDEKIGVEYSLARDKYFIRAGYDINLTALALGASLSLGMLKFDYGFSYLFNGPSGNFGSHSLAVGMNFGIRSSTPGSLSGRIIASENSLGLGNTTVKAMQNGKMVAKTVTDGNGDYTLGNLLEGYYDIEASAKGFMNKTLDYKPVYADETTGNINFRLYGSPGTITGKVTELDGITGIGGALVKAVRGNLIGGQALTKENGTYEILNLPEGKFDVEAEAKKHGSKKIEGVYVNKGDILSDISFQIAQAEQPKIAIMPLENSTAAAKRDDYGSAVANMITTALVKAKKFNVIERQQIEKILKEQSLWLTGAVDAGSSKKIGAITGVGFLIVGSVSKLGNFIELDVRMIDTESGKIIVSGNEKANSEDQIRAAIERLIGTMIKKF